MVIKIFFILLVSFNLLASEGVITVLEAPVFRTDDTSSKVLQYHRKGEKIYIHPAEFSRDKYEGLIEEDDIQILNYENKYSEKYRDELFKKGKTYFPNPSSRFYKTLTTSGVEAYILKEHVFLLYEDRRELTQKVIKRDNTDYRIDEPLPEGYPIAKPTGYRGGGTFGLGLTNEKSYPYKENINSTGYDLTKSINFIFTRQVKFDLNRRFFFGGKISIFSSTTNYITDSISSKEDHFKMGIGPYLSYDLWKTEKYIINQSGSLIFNFYDNKTISQKSDSLGINDKVDYSSYNFSPGLTTTFILRKITRDYDLVGGVNFAFNFPRTYKAQSSPNQWENSFEVGLNIEQNYFLGLQTDY